MKENHFRASFKDLRQNLHVHTVSAGLVAAIFGCTGPALIIIGGATSGGLTYAETISWIFAVYFFSGLLGIFLALKHRQPISGAHSIAGAVLVAGSLTHFSLNEAIGAYLVANIIGFYLWSASFIEKGNKGIPLSIFKGMDVWGMIRF